VLPHLRRHSETGPRDPTVPLRLATGDDEGRVAVWNVQSGSLVRC
jgi:hypothetical protein